MIFDKTTSGALAVRNPALGPPATLGESLEAAYDDIFKSGLTISVGGERSRQYDSYIDRIEKETGQKLFHPDFRRPPGLPEDPFVGDIYAPKDYGEIDFFREVNELAKTNPDMEVLSRELIMQRVIKSRAKTRSRLMDVQARTDTMTAIASAILSAPAFLADPPIMLTMPFGAAWSTGILRAALIDMGVVTAIEVPVQTIVQAQAAALGEGFDLGKLSLNVITAGVGAGFFSGAIRGSVRGVTGTRALIQAARGRRPLLKRLERQALNVLERQDELATLSPFRRTQDGAVEHEIRLSEAQRAIQEGRPAEMSPHPASSVREDAVPPVASREASAAAKEAAREVGIEVDEVQEAVAKLREATIIGQANDNARATILEIFGPLVTRPDELKELVRQLRVRPKPPSVRTLINFLRREGGLREAGDELKSIGITGRTRPGLVNRRGLSFDDAALRSFEEGFFPELGGRPTIAQFLSALDEEFRGLNVRVRPGDEAILADFRAIDDFLEAAQRALDDLDINVKTLEEKALVNRLNDEMAEGRREAGAAPVESEGTRRSLGRAQQAKARIERAEVNEDLALDALEADVRARVETKQAGDVPFFLDDGAGNSVARTPKQVLDDIANDEVLMKEFEACVGFGA